MPPMPPSPPEKSASRDPRSALAYTGWDGRVAAVVSRNVSHSGCFNCAYCVTASANTLRLHRFYGDASSRIQFAYGSHIIYARDITIQLTGFRAGRQMSCGICVYVWLLVGLFDVCVCVVLQQSLARLHNPPQLVRRTLLF